MSHKNYPSGKDSAVGRRLRREAEASRPAFSEALHRQILSAVQRHGAEEAVSLRAATSAARWPAHAMAAAAACALVVAVVFLRPWAIESNRPTDRNVAANGNAASLVDLSASTFDELSGPAAAENLDELFTVTTVAPQSAALKHDIRLAAESLIERLPVNVALLAGP